MGYVQNGLAADWTWQYRVFRYRVADPAPDLLCGARVGDAPAYPWAHWPGGVLVAEGVDQPGESEPTRTYDPAAEAEALLTAATRFDPADLQALVKFVNRWGLLGFAGPVDADQLWDSVFATREHLTKVRQLTARLDALKRRRWDSVALPSLAQIRRRVRGVPRSLTAREHGRVQWQAFAADINQALQGSALRPVLVATPGLPGLRQTLRPQRLADVLLVALWQHATDADLVLRRCDTCGGNFFVSISNTKRRYCSRACKNLAGVRTWRKKKGRK